MTNEASQRFLLDANVLIAVLDQQHEHHTAAVDWFLTLGDDSAITCPTVENACLRYLVRTGVSATDAHAVLTGLKADRRVTFAPEASSMSEASLHGVIGFRQVTDVYLCQIAAEADAFLATFDGGLHQMRPRRTLRVPTTPQS
jgi:predicted nucleic acid-binding protein